MAEMTVSRAGDHFAVDSSELVSTFTERYDLRRTDKREVQRIEEQHQVLSLVITRRDLLELTIHHCHALKRRCWFCRLKQSHDTTPTFTTTSDIVQFSINVLLYRKKTSTNVKMVSESVGYTQ